MSLKELTKDKHAAAESTPFMKAVFANKMITKVWTDYTYQKQLWYKEIERAAFAEKNEKLAFALAHPSFKALAAAGIAATDLPQQGGQSEDKQEVKQPTAKERYLAMKRDESISPVECAKFYEANKEAIRSGK